MKRVSFKKTLAALLSGMMLITASPAVSLPVAAADCVIDTATTYQTIDGFGGINHPEWTADKGGDLNATQRQVAFGTGDNELGMTVLRVFINPDRNAWKNALPTAQYAYEHGCKVFASPWEPPSNLAEKGTGGARGGKLHLPKSNYEAYAKHLNDFGNYMKENGVQLSAISVQNEPDWSDEWTAWSSDETTDFIANYGHLITSAPLMSPETFQYTNKDYYSKILANQKAFANCDLFGTHMYGTQRSQMDFPELEKCGKPIWMTEVYVPNSTANSANNWPEAVQVAENIHNALVVGNMSAYVWWTIRRSYGPITDDSKPSKRGFCIAQFSRYVRPGAKRIGATEQPASNVLVSAYKNEDGSIAIVAVNKGSGNVNQSFNVAGENISSVDRYRTSGSENIAAGTVSANGSSFSDTLPANSVTTYVVGAKSVPIEVDPDGYWFHDTFEDGTDSWSGRGGATAAQSTQSAYKGSNSLLVSDRSSSWNGAQKSLSAKMFEPGKEYSFSAVAAPASGTANMMLSLQYTDASGETQYDHIANGTASDGDYVLLSNPNYTIPAGATNVILYVETEDGTANFYVDEVIGAPAGTTIDGPKPVAFVLGDVDKDGKITASDMALAKSFVTGKRTPTAAQLKAADVDQNTLMEVADIIWYAKYLTCQTKVYPDKVAPPTPPKPDTRTLSQYVPVCNDALAMNETNDSKANKGGVGYGKLEKKSYYSNFCGRNKNYIVLLPDGYNTNEKYPVMYIMHGYWEKETRMILEGNGTMSTQQIIGNAIAEGAAKKMICVFPYIFSSKTKNDCDGMNDDNNQAYDNFETVLLEEVMPMIEKDYSVATGKENTAITGFSMGGRESLNIGMRHQDIFGYVGAICPAPGATGPWTVKSDEDAPYLIYITAGGNDQTVYTTPEGYHNSLTQNGVPHVWHYYPSGYHGDNSIHAHLYNFVRFAFNA